MNAPIFRKAERSQVFCKLAITGPSGGGKTYSALRLATGLLEGTGKRIAVIDTENGSASLYSDRFDFDVLEIAPPFEHEKFIAAVNAAVEQGYGCAILDSSSHFWEGILEYKSRLDSRPGTNSYTNWNEAGKKFAGIVSAVLQSKIHVICCLRSKMDYILESKDGKQVPRKIGLAPIMRDGIEYEFTTVFDVALNHECEVSKDRSSLFTDKIFQITEQTGKQIADWLRTATPRIEETPKLETVKRDGIKIAAIQSFATNPPAWGISFEDGSKAGTFDAAIAATASRLQAEKLPVSVTIKPATKPGSFLIVSLEEFDDIPI